MSSEEPVGALDCWQANAKYWTSYSDTIARMFAPLTEAMIERAGIHEGQSVLDVAGGAGEPHEGTLAFSGKTRRGDGGALRMEGRLELPPRRGPKPDQVRQLLIVAQADAAKSSTR